MRGHVCKRGSRYYAVLYLPDATGKKKQKWFSGFATRKAAIKFIAQKILDLKKHRGNDTCDSLDKFLEQWFRYQQTRLRPGTIRSYQWLLNRYIIPQFGSCRLSEITPEQVQTFYLELTKRGLSNQTILNLHRVLKNALNRAFIWGKIEQNVVSLVQPPRVNTPIFDTWTSEELRRFLRHAETSKYYIVFLIASTTGMRLGEILALRWSDCDLIEGIIRVRRTLTYTGHGYQVDAPKTKRGIRAVSLPSVVTRQLVEFRARQQPAPSPDSLVIQTGTGRPVLQHNLRTLFYTLIKQAGVPRIRIHDLRHTHASLLLQKGIHPKVVQERLGHASVETTLNIYSHVLPHLQEKAATAFNDLLQ